MVEEYVDEDEDHQRGKGVIAGEGERPGIPLQSADDTGRAEIP
jgi:hypothetical protein